MSANVQIIDSILDSMKRLLGSEVDYDHYDPEIIIHINTVLQHCNQIGVGLPGFRITDNSESWYDFLKNPEDGSVRYDLEDVKDYVYLKLRLLFDPPQSSAAISSMERLCSEIEWRIYMKEDCMATHYITKEEVEDLIRDATEGIEVTVDQKIEDARQWEIENDHVRAYDDVGTAIVEEEMEATEEESKAIIDRVYPDQHS